MLSTATSMLTSDVWAFTMLVFFFFFSGEGPARYGRTAAMRLIVQPYDEDDDYFLSFS
jgi:hypothetical protein